MRVAVAAGMALLLLGLPSWAQAQGKVCDNPRPMPGFKTCADVEKAEAEGAFVLYSTDPEAGQVKLLASFNKLFPKIKTSYVRLQAVRSTPRSYRNARPNRTWSTSSKFPIWA